MEGDHQIDRLERLQRTAAVRELVDRYAHGCDVNDADAVAGLFDDDGVLVVRESTFAGDEIAEFYRARLELSTLHFVTGLVTDERADRLVDATCGFAAIEMGDSGNRVVVGRYTDVIRVDGDTARFVSRRIDVTGKFGAA